MKKYIYQILAIAILSFTMQSCFQDLDNNPPFNFPQEPEKPAPPLDPSGIIFHMTFDGDFTDVISEATATVVGNPTRVDGKEGMAYAGAADSYLTFATADLLHEPTTDFSVAFWYNVNASPDRASIISIGAPTAGAAANAQNNRDHGLRIFREGNATRQVLKANIGTGTGDVWLDGGDRAAINPELTDWVHVALTITNGRAYFYLDGVEVSTATPEIISWTDCDIISIGSGAPRFTEWGHLSDQSLIDEVRFYNKTLSADEIRVLMQGKPALEMEGNFFYAPFNSHFRDMVSNASPAVEGTPGTAAGKSGRAFAGATDSYLSYMLSDLSEELGEELTFSFWYKVNPNPGRAGIISIGTEPDNRSQGVRIFREGGADTQIIKANVGIGGGEVWVDGGAAATINATTPKWVHIALVIDTESATLYIDGEVVRESAIPSPVDWTDCVSMSVGSGAPTFTEWNHLSDLSLIDELRLFDRALTAEEIAEIIAYDNE